MSPNVRTAVWAALLFATAAGLATADEKKEKAPPVSGLFKGNGQEAKLAYLSAHKGEPSRDKPTVILVFTEKDHSKDKTPRTKAFFGDYGSALIITVTHDGKVVGCEVAHSAHKKGGFNDLGVMTTTDFKVADGKVSGKLSSNGEQEAFGQKWEVKLKFETKAP